MNTYNPPIPDEAWMPLPFPFLEMQGADIEITTTDTSQNYQASFWIDRHLADDKLFSPVVIISNLPTADWATHVQLRIRLGPAAMSRLQREPTDSRYRYRLSISRPVVGYGRLLAQLQA